MSVSPTVLANVTVSPTLTSKSCMATALPSNLIDAYHAVAGERRDLGRPEAKLGEHFPGLRAEPLRRQANGRRLAVVAHRMIDQRDGRAGFARALNRHQRLRVLHLRIFSEVGIALHARVPDLRLLHAPAPVLGGFRLEPRGDQRA